MKKQNIDPESIFDASVAAKQFVKVLKKAKETPRFITKDDKVGVVIFDYTLYETMLKLWEVFEELELEAEIVRRIEHADAHPEDLLTLEEALGKEAAERILKMNPDEVLDNELFE